MFGMNCDDVFCIEQTEGLLRAINAPPDSFVTAVQNWNSAAQLATGELLFVISDDLRPTRSWDSAIDDLVDETDPEIQDFAIKITDSPFEEDTVLRHPIISRKFYEVRGLFDPSFRGVHCDNDITMRAYRESIILDGRQLKFDHINPLLDPRFSPSQSHELVNREAEYSFGSQQMRRKWGWVLSKTNLNRLPLAHSVTQFGKAFLRVNRLRIILFGIQGSARYLVRKTFYRS